MKEVAGMASWRLGGEEKVGGVGEPQVVAGPAGWGRAHRERTRGVAGQVGPGGVGRAEEGDGTRTVGEVGSGGLLCASI
jgi:hypothetical protein